MADYTIETALYSILANNAGVAALVGTRIHPNEAPDNATVPFIVYSQVSGSSDLAMDGPTGAADGQWQFSCWAATKTGATVLAEKVRLALSGYDGTVQQRRIRCCALTDKRDLYSNVAGTNVLRKYGKALTFEIHFDEAQS